MRQLPALTDDLFAPSNVQLLDDAEGGVGYWPSVIDATTAQAYFNALIAHADWTHGQRPMYDRIVDVPRLMASYAVDKLPGYLPLAELLASAQSIAPASYTRVGLNLYRDGRDSVAMHHDKLPTLTPGQPISLISLGATRRMLIRAQAGSRSSLSVDLAAGSLLRMSYASQLTHEHGIPKTRRPQSARISVVFRVRASD